mmetsp:Transcript_858/g.1971  ORF Transcript_858/g.1971 Transcript_858/m.1971 type:complete len:304 (-) Transcript_858:1815-2726(-)
MARATSCVARKHRPWPRPSKRSRPAACMSLSLQMPGPNVSIPTAFFPSCRSAPLQRASSNNTRAWDSGIGELWRGMQRWQRSRITHCLLEGSKKQTPLKCALSIGITHSAATLLHTPARRAPQSMSASMLFVAAIASAPCHVGPRSSGRRRHVGLLRRRAIMWPSVALRAGTFGSDWCTCRGSRRWLSEVPEKPMMRGLSAKCQALHDSRWGNCFVSAGNTHAFSQQLMASMLWLKQRCKVAICAALLVSTLRMLSGAGTCPGFVCLPDACSHCRYTSCCALTPMRLSCSNACLSSSTERPSW